MAKQEREINPDTLTALLAEEGALDEDQASELAEKNFSDGFGSPEEGGTPEPAPEPEPEPEPESPAEPAPRKEDLASENDQLKTRLRSLESKYGELNSKTQKLMKERAGAAAKSQGGRVPTADEMRQAISDEDSMAKFRDEFPEYSEALEIQGRMFEKKLSEKIPDTSGFVSREDFSKAMEETREEARAYARLDIKHPGWDTTITKPEFAQWLSSQDDKTKSLADSDNADDAGSLLDSYKSFVDQQNTELAKQREKERNKSRLEGAVAPTNRSSVARPRINTPEDNFEEGFRSG